MLRRGAGEPASAVPMVRQTPWPASGSCKLCLICRIEAELPDECVDYRSLVQQT